ncbi:MAG TPA: hypothetical protein VLL08_04775 [Kineosporiaceae bacterium]|nr:hypothetical protein [Kineosporiaceae bacterium]
MDDSWLSDDDQLLAELGAAMAEAQQVPDTFVQSGKSAFTWYGVDSELAALVSDSAAAATAPAALGMRSERPVQRSLTFATAELTIELDVHVDAVRGQVTPPRSGTVQVRGAAGVERSVDIDDLGWFVIKPVPVGAYRLSVRLDDGPSALTDWISE